MEHISLFCSCFPWHASSLFLLLPLVLPWLFSTFWYGFEEVQSNGTAPLHCWWSSKRATHTFTWPRDCALKVLWTRQWIGTIMKILSQHILLALWHWSLIWMGASLTSLFPGKHWLFGRLCMNKITEIPLLSSSGDEEPPRQRQHERLVVLSPGVLSW